MPRGGRERQASPARAAARRADDSSEHAPLTSQTLSRSACAIIATPSNWSSGSFSCNAHRIPAACSSQGKGYTRGSLQSSESEASILCGLASCVAWEQTGRGARLPGRERSRTARLGDGTARYQGRRRRILLRTDAPTKGRHATQGTLPLPVRAAGLAWPALACPAHYSPSSNLTPRSPRVPSFGAYPPSS